MDFEFTEEEVRQELLVLGYNDIPPSKLKEFMADLRQLAAHERSGSETETSLASTADVTVPDDGLTKYPEHTNFHWGVSPPQTKKFLSPLRQSRAFQKSKTLNTMSSFDENLTSFKPSTHASATHSRLAATPGGDDVSSASLEESYSGSSIVRRKVLRRDDNGRQDITTEELTYVEEDADETGVDADDLDTDRDCSPRDGVGFSLPRRVRPFSASSFSSSSSTRQLPSFIRRDPSPPRRRHDPVNRYHQYKEVWTAQRAPGEKQHKDLRWAVREQMQRRDEMIKPRHRYYVPNDYVPPTDKRRQDLRWEIRTQMAHKINPSTKNTAFQVWM